MRANLELSDRQKGLVFKGLRAKLRRRVLGSAAPTGARFCCALPSYLAVVVPPQRRT